MTLIVSFVEILLGNICYNNIDKVMHIADEIKWYVDPAIACVVAYYLMIIVMGWTLFTFPWKVLKSLTFWLDLLVKITDDHFHIYDK